jgi:hypothetical protein
MDRKSESVRASSDSFAAAEVDAERDGMDWRSFVIEGAIARVLCQGMLTVLCSSARKIDGSPAVQRDQSRVLVGCVLELSFQFKRAVAALGASKIAVIGEKLYELDILILAGLVVPLEILSF